MFVFWVYVIYQPQLDSHNFLGPSTLSSWWLNQPLWKIWSSNCIISPGSGEKKHVWKHHLVITSRKIFDFFPENLCTFCTSESFMSCLKPVKRPTKSSTWKGSTRNEQFVRGWSPDTDEVPWWMMFHVHLCWTWRPFSWCFFFTNCVRW